MKKIAMIVWIQCMNIKPDEHALIITDSERYGIARVLWETGRNLCKECSLVLMKKRSMHGEEPPALVSRAMLEADAIIIPTTFSLTHTDAVQKALKNGARIISMPGITKESFLRAIPVDYKKMKMFGERLRKKLINADEIRVKTKLGTDLYLKIKGRRVSNGYGIPEKGDVVNLPDGEVAIAPLEGKSKGEIMVDVSYFKGLIKKPFKILVDKGNAVGCDNKLLWKYLIKVRHGTNLAELGIGINPKAKITGNVLEDEKCLKTAHIAFGTNKSLGGKIQSSIHLDLVFNKPTIWVDNKIIIKNGKFL
jgi:leucyl aminopeptidase (aminopeptidase T)